MAMTVFTLSYIVITIFSLLELFLMTFIKYIYVLTGLKHLNDSFIILEVVYITWDNYYWSKNWGMRDISCHWENIILTKADKGNTMTAIIAINYTSKTMDYKTSGDFV